MSNSSSDKTGVTPNTFKFAAATGKLDLLGPLEGRVVKRCALLGENEAGVMEKVAEAAQAGGQDFKIDLNASASDAVPASSPVLGPGSNLT